MTYLLLQAGGAGGFGSLPVFALLLVVMYFFFFRPQMKKQKAEKKFGTEISKGMRVVLNSGIHGKILDLTDTTITIESENSRLKVERSAVSRELSAIYLPKEEKKEEKKEDKTKSIKK